MHEPAEMQGVAIDSTVAEPGRVSPTSSAPRPVVRPALPPFERVYDEHFDLVWRTLRRFGVRPPSLDDALQEVFVVVHDRLGTFEGRSTLRTWICGIARRVARDHRPDARLEIREPALLDALAEGGSTDTVADVEARDRTRLLYALLAELPADRREILILVELEQLTVAEAAVVLDENPNTVASRLRLGRRELAEAWERLRSHADWRHRCATMTRP